MSEHCCGNERLRCVENSRCRVGLLFAVTLAASAGSLAPIPAAQLLHSVHYFPLLSKKFLLFFSEDIIDIKCYISLCHATFEFDICIYAEMVTILSQHPSLYIVTDYFFLPRRSFKIYSFLFWLNI